MAGHRTKPLGPRAPHSSSRISNFPKASVSTAKSTVKRASLIDTRPFYSVGRVQSKQGDKFIKFTAKARETGLSAISSRTTTSKGSERKTEVSRYQLSRTPPIVPTLNHKNYSTSQRLATTREKLIIDLTGNEEGKKSSAKQIAPKKPLPEKEVSRRKKVLNGKHPRTTNFQTGHPYRSLRKDEFRLLVVYGKEPKLDGHKPNITPLIGRFIYASLEDPPAFEALSYTWGSPVVKNRVIRIIDNNRLLWVQITQNLEEALLHLRRSDGQERLMWADAVCINQEDVAERNSQVMRMIDIYSKAFNVCVWLGVTRQPKVLGAAKNPDDPGTVKRPDRYNVTSSFALRILDLGRLDFLVDLNPKVEGAKAVRRARNWANLGELLRRSWFTRRWVLQEISFAQKATVYWDAQSLNWKEFEMIATLYEEHIDQITAFQSITNSLNTRGFPELHAVSATSLVEMKTTVFRELDGRKPQRRQTLQSLVVTLPSFSVSDPKDIIYSVLSLAKDTYNTGQIVPDYSPAKSTVEVYMDFLTYAIKSSGCLDIICTPWAESRDKNGPLEGLPSWICVLSGRPFQQDEISGYYYRINADSLIDRPENPKYDATRGSRVGDDFKILKAPNRMMVRGKHITAINHLGDISEDGVIPMSWLDMAVQVDHRSMPKSTADTVGMRDSPYIPEPFWRTLVADRNNKGEAADVWYRQACQRCFRQLPLKHHGPNIEKNGVNTQRLIKNFTANMMSKRTGSSEVKFLRRVQATTWNRRFFTTAKGSSGIAPASAKERDVIFLLVGCSVPVVLRKFEGYYRLIGECYLDGAMNKELVDPTGRGWTRSDTIPLELR